MAERSFKKEVEQLRIGAGAEFRGEGILAVTKALLECGVAYVGGYQGAPISHLMDVLADAQELLEELGVHFEASASEATAAAMLAASVHYPLRGAVTWKSTVGTNVASDALANLASGGVLGGALIIVGEDYGEGSSIMQERSHAFAMKSQIWLLDPRPNLPSIVEAVRHGFELSEASNTPVMLELRIRACHVTGSFIARDNTPSALPLSAALETPRRDRGRIVLPPASFEHEREKIAQRWPQAVAFIKERRLNEWFGPDGDVGVILQGGMYNGVVRALELLERADEAGLCDLPLYVLNVTYPLVEDEILSFAQGKKALLVVEEGQPNYLEQAIGHILHQANVSTKLHGKDVLPMAGEYSAAALLSGLSKFLALHGERCGGWRPPAPSAAAALAAVVPERPAGFCTGCPERPIFSALKLVWKELGDHHVAADIGCHLFSILPPFDIGATTMGYGLGPASASAFNVAASKRSLSIIGDGGFWHNGLASGIANAVFNHHDGVILVVDNYYAAATGGQDIPSSRADNARRSTRHPIADAVRGLGVRWVRQIDRTYDVKRMRAVLKEALTTKAAGPKVVIASSECMLNLQRREKPAKTAAIAAGKRVERAHFGVDEDVCTGDHACIRLSGCPSLSVRHLADPLRDDPVACIDETCVGCGNCGEVADAAVLCPSFYRVDVIDNSSAIERWWANTRARALMSMQRAREARRLSFA